MGIKQIIEHEGLKYKVTTYEVTAEGKQVAALEVAGNQNYKGQKEIKIPPIFSHEEDGVDFTCIVKSIGKHAFDGNVCIEEVVIEGNEMIEFCDACFGNSSIKKLTIPSSIRTMANDCLQNTCLKHVVSASLSFPVHGNVLYNKTMAVCCLHAGQKECVIKGGTKKIATSTFYKHKTLECLTLPESIKTIAENAFVDCKNLSCIIVNAIDPPVVGEKGLNGIKDMCVVFVPKDSVDSYKSNESWSRFGTIISEKPECFIEDDVCYKPVDFDNKKAFVGKKTGYNGGVVIPSTVMHEGISYTVCGIYKEAFENAKLESVTVEEGVEEIGEAAFKSATIQSGTFHIPASIKTIGKNAFGGCQLESFTAVEGGRFASPSGALVDTEEKELLQYPSKKEDLVYELDDCVEKIGEQAFNNCSRIKRISIHKENPPKVSKGGLDGLDKSSCIILVPKGKINAYKKANGWKEFSCVDTIPDAFKVGEIEYVVMGFDERTVEVPSQAIEREKADIELPREEDSVKWNGFSFKIVRVEKVEVLPNFSEFKLENLMYKVLDRSKMTVRLVDQNVMEGVLVPRENDRITFNGFEFTLTEVGVIVKIPSTFTVDGIEFRVHDWNNKYVTVIRQSVFVEQIVPGINKKVKNSGFEFTVKKVEDVERVQRGFAIGGLEYEVVDAEAKTVIVPEQKIEREKADIKLPEKEDSVKWNGFSFKIVRVEKVEILPNFSEFELKGLKYKVLDRSKMTVRLVDQNVMEGVSVPGEGAPITFNGFKFTLTEVGKIVKIPSMFIHGGVRYDVIDIIRGHVVINKQSLVDGTSVPNVGEFVRYNDVPFVVKKKETITWLPAFNRFVVGGIEYQVDNVDKCYVVVPDQAVADGRNTVQVGSAVSYGKFTFYVQKVGKVLPSFNTFVYGNINYDVVDKAKRSVQVGRNPQASGSITIPNRVTYNGFTFDVVGVGDWAFDSNTKVTSVSLPDSIKYVGYCAFQTLDIPMSLPSSLERVGAAAFKYNLFDDLRLPSGLKEVGRTAFGHTTVKTKRAFVPSSVNTIDGNPFYGSTIEAVIVDAGNGFFKSQDGVLFSKDGQKLLVYPHEKKGDTYTIPNGVTTIGDSSFENNHNLTRLIIPATVNQLEKCALWACPSLKTIVVQGTTPPAIGDKSFNGVASSCVIVVPRGCAGRYRIAEGWKQFVRFIEEHGFIGEQVYSDGVYNNGCGSLAFSFPKNERIRWKLSFEFRVSERRMHWPLMLSRGCRVFGILLEENGSISITTNNQRNKYSLGRTYSLNTWHSVSLIFDNGLVNFQLDNNPLVQIRVDMNMNDGDNTWSCSNFSNGVKFKGYLRNIMY